MRIALLLALLAAFATTSSSCARRCRSAEHCQRECDCQDIEHDRVIPCNVFFSCNVQTEECEPALTTKTCDEICQEFAVAVDDQGNSLCGRRRCSVDADCNRSLTCMTAQGPNGEPGQSFDCEITGRFHCEIDLGFCEVAAAASDDDLCRAFCAPPQ